MIKNKCPKCRANFYLRKQIIASKSVPIYCENCGSEFVRKYNLVKAIFYLGFSMCPFVFALLYIAKGFNALVFALAVYFSLLIIAYIAELIFSPLIEFTDQQKEKILENSKKMF